MRKYTMNNIKSILLRLLIGFVGFLLLWELLYLLLDTHTIPAPAKTLQFMITVPDMLLRHSMASLLRVLTAIGISLIIGVPAGVLIGVNKACSKILSPLLYFIYPIPKVAFLPVFMLLFGLGNTSKIILIIWIIIFQIILSIRDGVEQIPPLYFKVMEGLCVTTRQKYRFLILPAVLPQIFSGLRISVGIALASLFFAENYATRYGMGYYILSAWTKMNYVEMFGGILSLGFLGILLFLLLDRLEAVCVPWMKK